MLISLRGFRLSAAVSEKGGGGGGETAQSKLEKVLGKTFWNATRCFNKFLASHNSSFSTIIWRRKKMVHIYPRQKSPLSGKRAPAFSLRLLYVARIPCVEERLSKGRFSSPFFSIFSIVDLSAFLLYILQYTDQQLQQFHHHGLPALSWLPKNLLRTSKKREH